MAEDNLQKIQQLREKRAKAKKMKLIAAAVIVGLILTVAAVCFITLSGPLATPKKTVTAFYNAVYRDSDLDALESCVVTELREEARFVYTAAGLDENYIASLREYTKNFLGGAEYTVEFSETSERDMTSSTLTSLKKQYSGVTAGKYVIGIVYFYSEKYNGGYNVTCELVKQGGEWHMTRYDLLPIGQLPTFS